MNVVWIRRSASTSCRQHVEVGLGELVELAPALDLRDRSRARRGSTAARARRSRSRSCRGASSTGRACRTAPRRAAAASRSRTPRRARSQISRSSRSRSPRRRARRSPPAGPCRAGRPRAPCRAARATSGSSTSSSSASWPRSASSLALACGQLLDAAARRRAAASSTSAWHAALLAQLGEREAAPRGVEQVGREQRVVGEPRRNGAERLGVMGDRPGARRARRPAPPGRRRSPATTSRAARRRRSARRSLASEQLALGRPRAPWTTIASGDSPSPSRAASLRARPRGRGPSMRVAPSAAAGAAAVGAERLLEAPQRIAQLELAEDLAQPRAVGLPRGLRRRVEVDGDVALDRREPLADARVVGVVRPGSPCAWRPRCRRRARGPPRASPNCCSSCAAVLSPIPGTPGMLSDVSPLSP